MNSIFTLGFISGSLSLLGYKYYKHIQASKEYEHLEKIFEEYEKFQSEICFEEYYTNDPYEPYRVIHFEPCQVIPFQSIDP